MPPETIDDIIRALDGIVDWAWGQKSRIGYFAALYRRVTRAVKDGIAQGRFQNGPRMEALDIHFANRYLQAFEQFRAGQQPTSSWQVAFDAAFHWYPIVVQQLVAGINAHINLDLGIAAAQTSPGDELPSLQADFNTINTVLAELVGTVEKEIGEISPLIDLLQKFGLRTETQIINFNMTIARDAAWNVAVNLAATSRDLMDAAIADVDLRTSLLGKLVVSPPVLIKLQLFPIRIFETGNVRHVLDVLAGKPAAAAASAGEGN
ncbi:MAG TPA: DUF5995 family protein [Candidatus Angelobacter sp.]|nr:DUF5995 family protein [Candidatus Angelobacter sp.]